MLGVGPVSALASVAPVDSSAPSVKETAATRGQHFEFTRPRIDLCIYNCAGPGWDSRPSHGLGVNLNLFDMNLSPGDLIDALL